MSLPGAPCSHGPRPIRTLPRHPLHTRARFPRALRGNVPGIAMSLLLALFLAWQSITGLATYNDEQRLQGRAATGYLEYLRTGALGRDVIKNWQGEFFEIGAFVLFAFWFRDRRAPRSSARPPLLRPRPRPHPRPARTRIRLRPQPHLHEA